MTIVCLKIASRGQILPRMNAHGSTLAELLTLAALIGATIEYVEVMKHRVVRRVAARDRAALEERSLQGLVRVFLADAPAAEAMLSAAHR
jgi:hypothetical protein